MKRAYKETWVENLALQQIAENWFSQNIITKEQFEKTKINFPENFYRPGIFVKIGLFLFACIACAFFIGVMSLFIIDAANNVFSVVSIFCCACFVFFLEYLIRERMLFHSGVDNALLYAALGTAITPVFLSFENLEIWQYCIFILLVFSLAIYRYADIYVSAAAFVALFTLLANLMMKFALGKALLPFAIIMVSVIIYFLARKIKITYYKDCRIVIEVLSLITIYLGGNYYVVREGNAYLSDLAMFISPQIPFASIFYALTLAIPLIFIFLGLKTHNRILLLVGLLALAFSIFTYRYYFGFLTVSQGLTVGGIAMILLSILCIKYLHKPHYGLCDEPDSERKLANFEALMAAQYLGQTPQENSLEFGGGSFSGGGAGDKY